MQKMQRDQRMTLRLSPEETAVASAVASETGLTVSDVMRQALRTAHAERFKALKPKPKK
jgi:hypothetical protein